MDKKLLLEKLRSPKIGKVLIYLGIAGIMLIFVSSFLPETEESSGTIQKHTMTSYEYCEWLEGKIAATVDEITGGKHSSVLVTLETGVEYIYATEQKTDNENTGDDSGGKFSESGSTAETYITVKDENGNESAVVLTELIPKVRGVSVVCEGGQRAEVQQAVILAVSTALNISEKDISVSGKGIY